MNQLLVGAIALMLGAAVPVGAQSLEELNIQIHGYGAQAFLYSTNNNIFTTMSSNGSPEWTEAVVNVNSQPTPKLRIAVQGQEVDPSYMWALLPQGIYPITSRSSILAHYGTVVYGTFKLSPKLGKLEYRGFAGEGLYYNNDGYFIGQAEAGFNQPNNIRGILYSGAIHWRTPLPGLLVGASDLKNNRWSAVYTQNQGSKTGTYVLAPNSQLNYFSTYEKNKIMVAYEYSRNWGYVQSQFAPDPVSSQRNDDRGRYTMASYKVTEKATAGPYRSENFDRQAPLGPAHYQKEWVVSGIRLQRTFLCQGRGALYSGHGARL